MASAAESIVQPVFTAVMMGDANGVLLGESVHTNVLERNNTYDPAEKLLWGHPVPAGDTWVGVYIDDLGVVQALTDKEKRTG